MLDRLLGWCEDKLFFVRKEAYPDFDRIMFEAREFAKTPGATAPPVIEIPLRRNWAEKVVTGEVET